MGLLAGAFGSAKLRRRIVCDDNNLSLRAILLGPVRSDIFFRPIYVLLMLGDVICNAPVHDKAEVIDP